MRRLIHQDSLKIFTRCGVPHSVLLAPFPENLDRMMSAVEIPRGPNMTGSPAVYDKAKQQKAIEGLKETILKDDLRSKGKLMVFSARDTDYFPNQLALSIAAFAIKSGKQFLWHSVYGGTRDDLRDEPDKHRTRIDACQLLVLSNLADNSTAMKIEKSRDILVQNSSVNRILVTAGMNPVEYCKTVLRMRADAFVWF